MRYLVDSNITSEIRYGARGNPGVYSWAQSVEKADLATSVICLFEIEHGIALVQKRDPVFHRRLADWMATIVLPFYEGRILDVDRIIARQCARLSTEQSRPLADALIAATALVHDLTVVTRNERHFVPMGVPVLNPWAD
jgi:predicted nucleic acid-binding protein